MKLVDLTRMLDPKDVDLMPEAIRPAARVMVPTIHYSAPHGQGADEMCEAFDCTRDDLPEGQGWGTERLEMGTHMGTHVDAPLHYGAECEGKPARTITDIDLQELYCDGIVLDMRELCQPNQGISVDALKRALSASGATPTPGCAIMLRTGQEKYSVRDLALLSYPGMTREGTLFLAGLGAKVLGTDALGWDRPFAVLKSAFKQTGNRAEIWDGHFAGRDKEVFIVQQLTNLAALPSKGFKVGFFPLRLARCSASPARVVAFVPVEGAS
jgi:kynurenine formamidase